MLPFPLHLANHIILGLFIAVLFYYAHHIYQRKKRKKKSTSHTEKQNTQFEETQKASEPESDMARMLELSNCEFLKKSMINMLRDLMDNIDNIEEQMVK